LTNFRKDLRFKVAELAASCINSNKTIYIPYWSISADGKAKVAYDSRLSFNKFKFIFIGKTDALFYKIKALITLVGVYY